MAKIHTVATEIVRILVTGGAGFVGRHLIQKILSKGWDVLVVDSLVKNSGGIEPKKWPLFDPTSFQSFRFLNQDCRIFFEEHPSEYFDYIFHLAAVVGGRVTIEQDPLAVATDLSIDAEMWKWCVKARPMKVINFSSSAAYPIHLQSSDSSIIKLTEDLIGFDRDLGMPDLTYGWAKLTNEYLGRLAWQRYEINSVVYRPFSGYGPDQDLSYPFPSICRRALDTRGQEEFYVWGSGRQSRDFIHIDDCIDGVLLTMDKISQGNPLNLSTGVSTSFIRFAEMATNLVGYKPKIIGDTTMPEGVASRVGDTSKQKELGFENKRSFASGVAEGIEFFLSRF